MMLTKRLLMVLAAIMFIFPGTLAYAHEKNEDAAAFFFLKKEAIDPPQAIESVEKEEGGRVFSFKVEEGKKDSIQYEMKILKDGKVIEVKTDPKSGKILKTESEGFFSRFSDDDRKKAPADTKFSLKDAVSLVEKHYAGKALGGAFQRNSRMEMFRIRMANNDGVFTVMVDADTGELFRIASEDRRNHHDEDADD